MLNPPCCVHNGPVICLESESVFQPLIYTVMKQISPYLCHKDCFPKILKISAWEVDPWDEEAIIFLGKLHLIINFHNHSLYPLNLHSLCESDSHTSLADFWQYIFINLWYHFVKMGSFPTHLRALDQKYIRPQVLSFQNQTETLFSLQSLHSSF